MLHISGGITPCSYCPDRGSRKTPQGCLAILPVALTVSLLSQTGQCKEGVTLPEMCGTSFPNSEGHRNILVMPSMLKSTQKDTLGSMAPNEREATDRLWQRA